MREILFRGFHPCDGPDTIQRLGNQLHAAILAACEAVQMAAVCERWKDAREEQTQ